IVVAGDKGWPLPERREAVRQDHRVASGRHSAIDLAAFFARREQRQEAIIARRKRAQDKGALRSRYPAPLVPSKVDLRTFGYLPLDVQRLRDSEFTVRSTGDEFKAAVLLWCAAWRQVPAGSLPDQDAWLARQCGAGSEWRELKPKALYGFIRCSDGRWYH